MSRTVSAAARAFVAASALLAAQISAADPDLIWLGDKVAVRDFVDGVLATQIATDQAVGATVAIVHNGEILMSHGYGVANTAPREPVDDATTLFRIGSISKLFVWIAVMQQVAAGKIDLHADVNTYLKDFEIPATFPEPITMMHLMTHTPGFEDRSLGLFASGPRTVGDFHQTLMTLMPKRIMLPGRYAAYSNYGAALAAHVVEVTSGENWDDYVDRHIVKPLGMGYTTTRQPVPKPLDEHLSKGYWREAGRFVEVPFEYITIPPAGSISSSAADMARFMNELLAKGDTPVLSATSRAQLFAPGYAHDPRLNRMLYGLYEQNSHGAGLVGHDGGTLSFFSMLLLCPSLDLGIFASYNNEGGEKAHEALTTAILDRLFGVPAPVVAADNAPVDARRYAGYYASLRKPVSGHDKLQTLLETFEVRVDGDHFLVLPGPGGPQRFVKIDKDLFASEDGRQRVAFKGDDSRATHLFIDAFPPIDFARVEPGDDPRLHTVIVAAALVTAAAVFVLWPLSWWRHLGRAGMAGETRATVLAVVNAALIIGFFVVIGLAIVDERKIAFGLPQELLNALWIPIALIPLLLLQLIYASRAWVNGFWWPARRIHYTLLTVAGIAFVPWAFYWHLTAVIVDA
jgi:CubicO group peptidase (beta-lactamase class C family)